MSGPVLIVGQGLAGTVLGAAFEQAGIAFEIANDPAQPTASHAAAGMVNPVTGQRLVKSWEVESRLPESRGFFGSLEQAWDVRLVRALPIWREFANVGERETFERKRRTGELEPYAVAHEAPPLPGVEGFWIRGGFQVNVPRLLSFARERWRRTGQFSSRRVDPVDEASRRTWVILAGGGTDSIAVRVAGLQRAKGTVAVLQTSPEVSERTYLHNRRQWLLPLGREAGGGAWVGSTYDLHAENLAPAPADQRRLLEAAGELAAGEVRAIEFRSGWRMNAPDKHPVLGVVPQLANVGVVNGLGSKGVLYAPWLALQWVRYLQDAQPFDPRVDLRRFG